MSTAGQLTPRISEQEKAQRPVNLNGASLDTTDFFLSLDPGLTNVLRPYLRNQPRSRPLIPTG